MPLNLERSQRIWVVRSKNNSALGTFWSSGKEKILPACSPTKKRSPARAMRSGFLKESFGKARSILKGCGGSGEPITREVVQAVRFGRLVSVLALGASLDAL